MTNIAMTEMAVTAYPACRYAAIPLIPIFSHPGYKIIMPNNMAIGTKKKNCGNIARATISAAIVTADAIFVVLLSSIIRIDNIREMTSNTADIVFPILPSPIDFILSLLIIFNILLICIMSNISGRCYDH